ncbi:hypothetical protein CEXT_608761 [Caerostris extrusa]|uniref:Uncharacterized protein n=1 Tax=Caerostris extrusa TaxID=172846 RepID=A0AAV4TXT9_CAEEX|nr:hypothetical protein CEXT_608761 [Caerostris extrusa]
MHEKEMSPIKFGSSSASTIIVSSRLLLCNDLILIRPTFLGGYVEHASKSPDFGTTSFKGCHVLNLVWGDSVSVPPSNSFF